MVKLEFFDLLLQIFVLHYHTVQFFLNRTALAKLFIFTQELLNAWDKLQLFFGWQLLILVKQQLKFILEPLDQLV